MVGLISLGRGIKTVITGYNTDVEHDGVVYHVQTEDKGLDTPIILSLVYAGGAILASKRSPYEDLLASGFSEHALAERLNRQHRLICAAILAGRIADLRRMGSAEAVSPIAVFPIKDNGKETVPDTEQAEPEVDTTQEIISSPPLSRESPLGAITQRTEGLTVTLLDDEEEFRSGDSLMLRVLVSYRKGDEEQPLKGVAVSVKILGTTFRPQIQTIKTESDGVAIITTQVPQFSSGRAAILIRTSANGETTEIRRVILPGV